MHNRWFKKDSPLRFDCRNGTLGPGASDTSGGEGVRRCIGSSSYTSLMRTGPNSGLMTYSTGKAVGEEPRRAWSVRFRWAPAGS